MARERQNRNDQPAPLLGCPRPASATRIGSGGDHHRRRLGDAATTVAVQDGQHRRDYQRAVRQQLLVRIHRCQLLRQREPSSAIAVSALLVAGCRGAVLSGVAVADPCHGVGDSPGATPESRRTRLTGSVPCGADVGCGGVLLPLGGADLRTASIRLLLPADTCLAVGAGRNRGVHGTVVAQAPERYGGGAGMVRSGDDRRRLPPDRRIVPVSGCGGSAAYRWRSVGDRRRLRDGRTRSRSTAGNRTDARDRPGFLFMVSVALAGSGSVRGGAGTPPRARRRHRRARPVAAAGHSYDAFRREPGALFRDPA